MVAVSHTGQHSGAERVLSRLLRTAVDDGWDVSCLVPQGPLVQVLREAGVRTVLVPALSLGGGPKALAATAALLRGTRAAAVLRREAKNADCVVVNGLLGLPAARLARLTAPVVWLVHDIVRRPVRRAVLRAVAPAVDLAVTVSEAAAEPLRGTGLAIRVVHNGTTWPVAPVREPGPEPPVIGCLGLLTHWKGQHVLLEAAAGLPPDVRVELVGGIFPKDGEYARQLVDRASRPDLQGRVTLVGQVDDVHERLRSWTVLVSPSVEPDPAPLAVLEGMSVGLPVVATDHGGPREYLGEAGLLVRPDDPGALRDALLGLLADPALRARCGLEGRARVERHYQGPERLQELLGVVSSAGRRVAAGRVR
ncbi:MAG: glycosyltransferase [Frankiales bacterium]|nr:glycosyltransferase [Frankiales bacterium]